MVDIESMIKSLRLAWLKRIFGHNSGAWKNYLEYLLKETGGLVIFNCNYNVKDQFSILHGGLNFGKIMRLKLIGFTEFGITRK